ncbi:MAG TPA: TIGR01777 family oxidoreductase [Pirellulales bacterium]|jgi:hypothetical protein|nr:TIGR01777 family oxidoreductase [Pirellulales bacterium]
MRALVTGATGFVGRRLLEQIDDPVMLSRDPDRARQMFDGATLHRWEPMEGPPPAAAFDGVEAVFHLAGDSIGEGRWTEAKKRRIRASRVIGTENLVRGLAAARSRPKVLVSASAIGFYGSRGDEVLTEQSAAGDDFLAQVCQAWEEASRGAEPLGVRVVNPRIGVVLGEQGGALAKMLLPFRLGLGGRLGSGRQWMSWVHLDDLIGLMLHGVRHGEIVGAMNAVAPEPVMNRDFTRTLAEVLHRPAVLPAPAIGLRLMLGEFADVLLGSQRVTSTVAEKTGYRFVHPRLRGALESAVLGQPAEASH